MTPSSQHHRARARLCAVLAVIIFAAAVIASGIPAAASGHAASRPAARTLGLLPRVLVGSGPQQVALDTATHTAYVADQNDDALSVINTSSCNALNIRGCGQVPATVAAGNGPVALAVNQATDTVYVADVSSDTVSVINGATCNASRTSGCGQKPPLVTVAGGPDAVAVDPATDTVYVTSGGTNFSGTGHELSVINGATCNGTVTSSCGQVPATVTVGSFPFGAAFDSATDTVYVTNANDNTMSVVNAAVCNAERISGCGQRPPTVTVGRFPIPVAVDRLTDTVYVGNANASTVSVIDGATCNGKTTSGCGQRPPTVTVAGGPDGLGVNQTTDTVFASNNTAGTTASLASVSVINGATCNATVTTGCGQRPPVALTGANPGAAAVDQATNTAYVPALGDNAVAVINGATCNATITTGCGQTAPSTPAGVNAFSIAIDQAAHTAYVGDSGGNEGFPFTISVIDTSTCNSLMPSGCGPRPPAIAVQGNPYGLAVNQATSTLYASNIQTATGQPGRTVSVINTATCNGSHTTGCGKPLTAAQVGRFPAGVAVNQPTNTIYVANAGGTTVSVINGAACNSHTTSGCGRTPPTVHLGTSPLAVAVDQATDTIYILNPGTPATVSVINGAACNGTVTTGCAKVPPTVTVGSDNPADVEGLAVNQATDTIYVVNTGDDTVSVINGATCNREVTSGCGRTPAHVNVGRQGFGFVTVDPTTDLVYVSNYLDDTISVINGATCNGKNTAGCKLTPPEVTAGPDPAGLAFDHPSHTLYAADNGGGALSLFRFQTPQRPTGVVATAHAGKVDLRWRPPYDGGLPIIYHTIPTPACPACRSLTTPSTSGAPFTTITGLTPGQRYTFKIKATDAAGTGPVSARSNPVTP
jgi:YVTN family beta-propeller protein